jgi:hypothetical protein
MADEPESLVLGLLRQLGDKIDRVDTKVDHLVADQTAMRTEFSAKFERADQKIERVNGRSTARPSTSSMTNGRRR